MRLFNLQGVNCQVQLNSNQYEGCGFTLNKEVASLDLTTEEIYKSDRIINGTIFNIFSLNKAKTYDKALEIVKDLIEYGKAQKQLETAKLEILESYLELLEVTFL